MTESLLWLLSRFEVKLTQLHKGFEVSLMTGRGYRHFEAESLEAAVDKAFREAANLPLPK